MPAPTSNAPGATTAPGAPDAADAGGAPATDTTDSPPMAAPDETQWFESSQPSQAQLAAQQAQSAQLLKLAERHLNPETLGLVSAALALRQLADPNYRRKLGSEFVASDLNYLASMLNVGALYSGSIVRANVAASTMLNKDAALAANIDADISWELPICRVIGARTNIGFDRFAEQNNLRGYLEGSACLPFVVTSMEFRAGYRFGVRPAVIDQALQTPKEFGGVEFGMDARAYRLLRSNWDADFWTMNFGVAFNNYEDPNQADSVSFVFTAAPVSFRRYGRGFGGGSQTHEILRATIRTLSNNPGLDSLAYLQEIYRVEGIRIGDKVGLSFSLGVAQAQAGKAVDYNVLVTPGGFVAVAVGDLTAYTETRISSFAQASDREIALSEYRATQRFVKQTEKIYLDAQAYAGLSRLVFLNSISAPKLVFGGTVDAMVPLWKGINLYVRGEAARIQVPDAGNAVSIFATNALVGLTYSRQHDFVNHRKPVTDPNWSGAVPVTAPATVY